MSASLKDDVMNAARCVYKTHGDFNHQKKDLSIRYIIRLNDNFRMPDTTIDKEFCASIDHFANGNIYFKIHASNAIAIIPEDKILWMAPSKILWKYGYRG